MLSHVTIPVTKSEDAFVSVQRRVAQMYFPFLVFKKKTGTVAIEVVKDNGNYNDTLSILRGNESWLQFTM